MQNYMFAYHGTDPKVPPLPGFIHNLVSNLRLTGGICSRGLFKSRIDVNDCQLVTCIALAESPSDFRPYVRLVTVQWITPGEQSNPGLAIEGDPFSSTSLYGGGYILRHVTKDETSLLEKCGSVIDGLISGLNKANILEGCRVDVSKLATFVDDGLMERIVIGCITGNRAASINACDPNSMELVDDLNYEVALGIGPEPSPKDTSKQGILPFEMQGFESSELPKGFALADAVAALRLPQVDPGDKRTLVLSDGWRYALHTAIDTYGYQYFVSGPNGPPDNPSLGLDVPVLLRTGPRGFLWTASPEGFIYIRVRGLVITNFPTLYNRIRVRLRRFDLQEYTDTLVSMVPTPDEAVG